MSTTCSRHGCSKTLRKNNTTGVCATGCLSLEAPPGRRAKTAGELGATQKEISTGGPVPPAAEVTDLAKFWLVNEALGHDPHEVLNEFAREWLTALKLKMAEG